MPAGISYSRLVGAFAVAFLLATANARASRMVQVDVHSDLLSAFWNQPVSLHADVLLPDSYDTDTTRRYRVLYWLFGYGSQYDAAARKAWGDWARAFAAPKNDTIVVFPDPMVASYVYTEFANSANAGPWGDAFADELVPYIDRTYRTSRHYIGGHSSGAWAALWQQIQHPRVFDGAWAYAPDPTDFHDFTGSDLTATPPGNFYYHGKGELYWMRGYTRPLNLRDMAQGADGGIWPRQFASFEAVFSPRGADGTPAYLFDRKSGAINAEVAAYWEANYDLATIVKRMWTADGPSLRGKIHLIVGTADTFNLDGPSRRFCAVLEALNADAECTFVRGGDHFTILTWNGGYERHVIDEIFLTMPA
jgi:hypothetical protein